MNYNLTIADYKRIHRENLVKERHQYYSYTDYVAKVIKESETLKLTSNSLIAITDKDTTIINY